MPAYSDYRGYEKEKIDADPVLKLAWVIAQIQDDAAPINWWRWCTLAACLLDNYDMKYKGP